MKSIDFFKFCPACGGPLTFKDGELHCGQCGFTFYQNAKPTASVLIYNDKNELLFVRRGIEPKKGMWDIAGGFLEEWEAPDVGARREITEELGVELGGLDLVGVYPDEYTTEYTFATMNVIYASKISSGTITPQDDVDGYEWFAKEAIPWQEIAFDWIRQAVEDFYNK